MKCRHLSSVTMLLQILFAGLSIQEYVFGQWTIQNSTTTKHLHGVSFLDSLSGWAVGDSGTIIHSSDGGHTWTHQNSGTSFPLLSVSFCSNTNGWVAGDGGTLLKTTDGGYSWQRIYYDTSVYILNFKIQSFSPSTIIVLRSRFEEDFWTDTRISKSTDGGIYWTSFENRKLTDMFFLSSNIGWSCGPGGSFERYEIHRTVSPGVPGFGWPWSTYWFDYRAYNSLSKITFADSLQGWATDGDTLFSSTDGGVSWNYLAMIALPWINDIWRSGDTGYATTGPGKIVQTTDGGHTWTGKYLPGSASIEDMIFINTSIGWVVGRNGYVAHTTEGVITSNDQLLPSTMPGTFRLNQNYPNPFNPATSIAFTTPRSTHVSIVVYDVLGRKVDVITSKYYQAGTHTVNWSPHNITSSIYFYRMVADDFTQTNKLVYSK